MMECGRGVPDCKEEAEEGSCPYRREIDDDGSFCLCCPMHRQICMDDI